MRFAMRSQVLLIVLFCFTLSCNRFPDPFYETLRHYSFAFDEDPDQRFFEGELVSDSIKFLAANTKTNSPDSVKVIFEVAKGGGQITVSSAFTDKNGFASTGWKLGSESFRQILRAKTYDMSGNYLTSTDLVEYGFRVGKWDTVANSTDSKIAGMVADTINKFSLIVTNNKLYRQAERYYIWKAINDPVMVSPRTINMDKNGVVYVSTWNGELIKSIDHGITWIQCTKPYPDRPYYIYVYIANDNYVWAYIFDHPTRFSKDGGITWNDAGSSLTAQGFGDIFRLKDGSLLYHGSNCCNLNRSFDNGLTWIKIETPGYSNKLYVNDKDEIFITSQASGGLTFYKSTDYGVSFKSLYTVFPKFGTSMDNIFNKRGNFYYILVPGYGILKSFDLNTYEVYWINYGLNNLFIDHKGVLIAKDWDMKTIYYRKN
jgi:hypothetical protein